MMEKQLGNAEVDHKQSTDPLSNTERVVIQETWGTVYKNCEDVGTTILVRFFVKFPSAKQYFVQFQHMEDPKEMEQCAQLRKHAMRIMNAINSMVESLSDTDKISSILDRMGKTHALRHKVEPTYFKLVSGVILEVLAEGYPDSFTPEAQQAWTKLLGYVYLHLTRVYKEPSWFPFKKRWEVNGGLLGITISQLLQQEDTWVWTMCTTIMILSTLAIFLRRRFSNKVKPYPEDGSGKELAYVQRDAVPTQE